MNSKLTCAGIITPAGNNETAYQFTQKNLDNLTGFYYFGARYYDPSIGRWFVPDPILSDFSPYSYCYSAPLQYIDPNGKSIWPAIVYLALTAYKIYYQQKHGPPPPQSCSFSPGSYANLGSRGDLGQINPYGDVPTGLFDTFSSEPNDVYTQKFDSYTSFMRFHNYQRQYLLQSSYNEIREITENLIWRPLLGGSIKWQYTQKGAFTGAIEGALWGWVYGGFGRKYIVRGAIIGGSLGAFKGFILGTQADMIYNAGVRKIRNLEMGGTWKDNFWNDILLQNKIEFYFLDFFPPFWWTLEDPYEYAFDLLKEEYPWYFRQDECSTSSVR